MHRRAFLQALGLAAGGLVLPLGRGAWARLEARPGPRLVVVLLRGAVDGLSVVVPWRDAHYAAARPGIGLAAPGEANGVLPLDATFGLHPALAPLLPAWQGGRLAFVHACGDPAGGRSHFEAQAAMEAGTPGRAATDDGWLGRLAAQLGHEAVALDATLPRVLRGGPPAQVVPPGRGATTPIALDRPGVQAAFDRLYRSDDPLSRAYRQGRAQREALLADLAGMEAEAMAADGGARSAAGLARDAATLARLLVRHPSLRVAFLPVGGWDTHVGQGGARGQLATRLGQLAEGLVALERGLGAEAEQAVIVVMSEFGRTVAENGNGGTDHGHGNVVWLLGAGVAGGRVHGRWPGLAPEARFEGRDLAVTTDWRQVVAAVLGAGWGLTPDQLGRVMPGLGPSAGTGVPGLMRP